MPFDLSSGLKLSEVIGHRWTISSSTAAEMFSFWKRLTKGSDPSLEITQIAVYLTDEEGARYAVLFDSRSGECMLLGQENTNGISAESVERGLREPSPLK